MDGSALTLLALSCALVLLVGAVIVLLDGMRQHRVAARLQALAREAGGPAQPARSTVVARSRLSNAGRAIRTHSLLDEADARDLATMAIAAGVDPNRASRAFTASKLGLMAGLPLLAWAFLAGSDEVLALLGAGVGFLVGMLAPNWVLASFRARFARRRQRGLAEALDLMVVCSEAGLGLESTVDRVAREMTRSNPAVGVEFNTLSQELRVLPERSQALTRLGERTNSEEVQRLTSTLNQTLRYGTPLAQSLRTLATDLRRERMVRLEERAARLPALLILPLVVFIMPCVFVVLVGPSIILMSRVF